MDAVGQAHEWRQRAQSLRRFASRLERAELVSLDRLGGDATWYGPTAGAFLDDCRLVQRWVIDAVAGLRQAAARLDHGALELEHQPSPTGA